MNPNFLCSKVFTIFAKYDMMTALDKKEMSSVNGAAFWNIIEKTSAILGLFSFSSIIWYVQNARAADTHAGWTVPFFTTLS